MLKRMPKSNAQSLLQCPYDNSNFKSDTKCNIKIDLLRNAQNLAKANPRALPKETHKAHPPKIYPMHAQNNDKSNVYGNSYGNR